MTGACLCGAVSITLNARPEFINDCNCSLCRKAGAAWGYFPSSEVTVSGDTVSYVRTDKAAPGVAVHSCAACSATTHWVLIESFKQQHNLPDQTGVNMRLFDPDELSGIEVRYPDGKAWTGDGPFESRRAAMTISDSLPW